MRAAATPMADPQLEYQRRPDLGFLIQGFLIQGRRRMEKERVGGGREGGRGLTTIGGGHSLLPLRKWISAGFQTLDSSSKVSLSKASAVSRS